MEGQGEGEKAMHSGTRDIHPPTLMGACSELGILLDVRRQR